MLDSNVNSIFRNKLNEVQEVMHLVLPHFPEHGLAFLFE
jgi:hypothetical protein